MPGLVKIGMTKDDPEVRAQQLSTTGVPSHFRVHGSVYTFDPAYLESIVHEAFAAQRVASGREFFSVSPDEALDKIEEMHKEMIEGVVEEFLETHCLVDLLLAIDVDVIFQKANDLDIPPYDVAGVFEEMHAAEMAPALERLKAKKSERKNKRKAIQ